MKNDELMLIIGSISDEMIEAADKKPPVRRFNKKVLLAAALISLIVISSAAVGIWKTGGRKSPPEIPNDITVTADTDAPTTDTSDTSASPGDTAESTEQTAKTTGPAASKAPEKSAAGAKKYQRQPSGTIGGEATTGPEATTAPEATTGPDDTITPDDTSERDERPGPEESTDPEKQDPDDDLLFADVDVNNLEYKSIEYVVEKGYMQGRTEKLFEPEADLTRAEFAYALYAMAGFPEMTGYYKLNKCFFDTEIDEWYYDAVLWSRKNMIVNGNIYNGPEDLFFPDKPITRADIASAMLRLCNYLGLELTGTCSAAEFDDIDAVPENTRNAVRTLAEAGVITGKDGNMFDPYSGATRAESAAMIKNLMDNSKEHSLGLLEKYGLTLAYGANKQQSGDPGESQKIVVSLKSAGDMDAIPKITVEGDIRGNGCAVYGVEFTKKELEDFSGQTPGDLAQFIYCLKQPDGSENPVSGYFCDDEILTVNLKITIGDESTNMTLYLKVVRYS